MSLDRNVSINTSDPILDQKIAEWLKWDKNETTLKEVLDMLKDGNLECMRKLFTKRLEFGTAGLRAKMGAGYAQMNDLVVIQTAQGLAEYLLSFFNDSKEKGVVIGFDARYNSKRFAELSAAVFLSKNIKVQFFSEFCPTPLICFAVRDYDCVAGIMVTASHNPKEDNGYKIYWRNGVQINSPHDKEIQKFILYNLEPIEAAWDTSLIYSNPLFSDPMPETMIKYFNMIKESVDFPEENENSLIKVVYTPLHGVGYKFMSRAFEVGHLDNFYPVLQQVFPDPDFPTVVFPNPEEGKVALVLAIKTANESDCTLILSNDPDADRLGVAEKDPDTKDWKLFDGNEIGALLGWWLFFCFKHRNLELKNFENVYMLSSTVSSKILHSMSKKEGFQFEETLTGFKWMGNVANNLMREKKTVLFAFEEAIGFMCGDAVLDKDGISSAVKVMEMASYLKEHFNMTLQQKLKQLYTIYGHHITLNSYFICKDKNKIKMIFHRLRNFDEESNKSYPSCILKGKYQISGVRDLNTGYDDSYPDKKARLPHSKFSNMITFKFTNGLVATIRSSGTEPKIKYYSELCAEPEEQNIETLQKTLEEMVGAIVDEFLQPSLNGLLPRA